MEALTPQSSPWPRRANDEVFDPRERFRRAGTSPGMKREDRSGGRVGRGLLDGAVPREDPRVPLRPPPSLPCQVLTAEDWNSVMYDGIDLQVYSVRQRDRGPDYRCFVELGVSETTIQTVDGTLITQLSSGRCYVPACLKAATQGVVENQCQHIKLAVNCQAEATPLTLKSSVLNAVQASPETKQTIWQLATEPTGPLVQRITKNILVVKCKASQKHSLGYLHTSFVQKISAKSLPERRFFCSCQTLKSQKSNASKDEAVQRCIHFFACICAFASDETLAQEFSDFLNFDSSGRWCR